MRIEMLYFAGVRDLVGRASEALDLPAEVVTVADLRAHLEARSAPLAGRLGSVRLARNERFADDDERLEDGDTVALIPPVAGGSGSPPVAERVRLTTEPLSIDAACRRVRRPEAGALAVFVGVVRNHHGGKGVERLEYSAYESMALAEMARVIEELEAAHSGVRLAVHHRIGALEVGDDAVVCAASSAHRGAAFEAGRALIDQIKDRVPIWKYETHTDGQAHWVRWDVAET